ncbi:hypothetical protein T06_3802 [Trichinella sp. T6]|nr:hypothetical protein T06_3802 [Trichinella sp. T6]
MSCRLNAVDRPLRVMLLCFCIKRVNFQGVVPLLVSELLSMRWRLNPGRMDCLALCAYAYEFIRVNFGVDPETPIEVMDAISKKDHVDSPFH